MDSPAGVPNGMKVDRSAQDDPAGSGSGGAVKGKTTARSFVSKQVMLIVVGLVAYGMLAVAVQRGLAALAAGGTAGSAPLVFLQGFAEGLFIPSVVLGVLLIVAAVIAAIYRSLKNARGMSSTGAYAFMVLIALFGLVGPMPYFPPKTTLLYGVLFGLIAVGWWLGSAGMILFGKRKLSLPARIEGVILMIPGAILPTFWALMFGQGTLGFIGSDAELWMKILIGILAPLYALGCLIIPLFVVQWWEG